jgi:hypothetical protein
LDGLHLQADEGSIEAATALAHIYFYGGDGIQKNYETARHWLEVVNRDGYVPYAIYRLGNIYYEGLGIKPDFKIAYRLFRKIAVKGHPRGLLMVAGMQKKGYGVLKKPRSARVIFSHCLCDKRLNFAERAFALFWM